MNFEEAIENKDIILIMHKSGSIYSNILPYDTLCSCKMVGVWKACSTFKPEKGLKFTGYVYCNVRWECLKAISQESKQLRNIAFTQNIEHYNVEYYDDNTLIDLKDSVSESDYELLKMKIYDRLTLKEIGKIKKYSHEQARKKINKALKNVENTYDKRVNNKRQSDNER
jgi:RNA polymerase sigma factor (sigma-70 family)